MKNEDVDVKKVNKTSYHSNKKAPAKKKSVLANLDATKLRDAIILSEIVGRPVSLRRDRGR